jgi:hypothetical protein
MYLYIIYMSTNIDTHSELGIIPLTSPYRVLSTYCASFTVPYQNSCNLFTGPTGIMTFVFHCFSPWTAERDVAIGKKGRPRVRGTSTYREKKVCRYSLDKFHLLDHTL